MPLTIMAKNIKKRSDDYAQWYLDVIKAAKLADYAGAIRREFKPCDELRRRTAGEALLTDDSMGNEWTGYPVD